MHRCVFYFLNVFLMLLLAGCGGAASENSGDTEYAVTSDAEEGSAAATAEETVEAAEEAARETGERPELLLENFLTEDGALDMPALQAWNEECCGWIEIVGTNMSYPVVQSAEDVAFYLSHNFFGDEDDNGCVYTEYYNSADFSDPHTLIYGRNTSSMFGRLHQYQDRDFFDSYREIKIYLADQVLTYQIFAAYTYDDRHLIMSYDCWDKNVYSLYLASIFDQRQMDAFVDSSVEVTTDDRMITLSTGVTGEAEKRYLVQAVLVTE